MVGADVCTSGALRRDPPATVGEVRVAALSSILGAVVALEFAGIGGASASNMEAVIESVSPDPGADTTFEIVAGDGWVRVESTGADVLVLGYEGEEYLRIDSDGSTWVNSLSRTRVINSERYGPNSLDGDFSTTEQEWVRQGSDGTVMWHDHRVHWMNPDFPPGTDDRGVIQTFEIEVEVDGVPTTVSGTLYLRSMAPSWWWSAALVGASAAVVAARRRRTAEGATVLAVAAIGLGAVQFAGLPHGARVAPVLLAVGMLASVLAVVGVLGARSPLHRSALVASACSWLVLGGWSMSDHVRSRIIPGLDGLEWTTRALVPLLVGYGAIGFADQVARLTGRLAVDR